MSRIRNRRLAESLRRNAERRQIIWEGHKEVVLDAMMKAFGVYHAEDIKSETKIPVVSNDQDHFLKSLNTISLKQAGFRRFRLIRQNPEHQESNSHLQYSDAPCIAIESSQKREAAMRKGGFQQHAEFVDNDITALVDLYWDTDYIRVEWRVGEIDAIGKFFIRFVDIDYGSALALIPLGYSRSDYLDIAVAELPFNPTEIQWGFHLFFLADIEDD